MKFTETQQKIWDVLKDGEPHRREELMKSFTDELTSDNALDVHLTQIRKQLRGKGQDIICQFVKRRNHFRLIQLVSYE